MAINFPPSPTPGELFQGYSWNGYGWAGTSGTYIRANGTVPMTGKLTLAASNSAFDGLRLPTGTGGASAPVEGDFANNGSGNLFFYSGTAWRPFAFLDGGTFTGQITGTLLSMTSTITQKASGVGGIQIVSGDTVATGYIGFLWSNSVRVGYVNVDTANMNVASEVGRNINLVPATGIVSVADRVQGTYWGGTFQAAGSGNNMGSFWEHRGFIFPSGAGSWGSMGLRSIYVPAAWAGLRLNLADTWSFDFRSDNQAYKAGGGSWGDISDERIKNVVGPYEHGLAEILALNPVRYTFKGNDTYGDPEGALPYTNSNHYGPAKDGKEFIGLIAQSVEDPLPECVKQGKGWIDGVEVDDLRDLDPSPLVFALINAVKELTARVAELEAKL